MKSRSREKDIEIKELGLQKITKVSEKVYNNTSRHKILGKMFQTKKKYFKTV